eukprot:403334637
MPTIPQYFRAYVREIKTQVEKEKVYNQIILTDFLLDVSCMLTDNCHRQFKSKYPRCFKNTPYSLDKLIVQVNDYEIVTYVNHKYGVNLSNFDVRIVINEIKIVYGDRLKPEDVDYLNKQKVYSSQAKQVNQYQPLLQSIKYYIHHLAKVQIYDDCRNAMNLPKASIFIDQQILMSKESTITPLDNGQDNIINADTTAGTTDSKYIDSQPRNNSQEFCLEIRESQDENIINQKVNIFSDLKFQIRRFPKPLIVTGNASKRK